MDAVTGRPSSWTVTRVTGRQQVSDFQNLSV